MSAEDTPPAEVSIHVLIDQFMADLFGAVALFEGEDMSVYDIVASACPDESARNDLFMALVIKEFNSRLAAQRAERGEVQ